MNTLAPPMFPHAASRQPAAGTAVPFGLSTGQPIGPPAVNTVSTLTYCPDRQVSLLPDGQPFTDAPSMATSIQTVTQTQEDMRDFTDNDGTDTD